MKYPDAPRATKTQLHRDFLYIIRHRLDNVPLTRTQYAEAMGVPYDGLCHVLAGRTAVSFERADLFGRALGMTLRMVIDEEETKE